MCLITTQQKPRIIKRDLVVYKRVKLFGKNIVSAFYPTFNWKEDILVKRKMKAQRVWYRPEYFDGRAFNHYHNMDAGKLVEIYCGLHASLTKKRLPLFSGTLIGKFVVPKGSMVFKDATGLIVSNQMIFIKLCKDAKGN